MSTSEPSDSVNRLHEALSNAQLNTSERFKMLTVFLALCSMDENFNTVVSSLAPASGSAAKGATILAAMKTVLRNAEAVSEWLELNSSSGSVRTSAVSIDLDTIKGFICGIETSGDSADIGVQDSGDCLSASNTPDSYQSYVALSSSATSSRVGVSVSDSAKKSRSSLILPAETNISSSKSTEDDLHSSGDFAVADGDVDGSDAVWNPFELWDFDSKLIKEEFRPVFISKTLALQELKFFKKSLASKECAARFAQIHQDQINDMKFHAIMFLDLIEWFVGERITSSSVMRVLDSVNDPTIGIKTWKRLYLEWDLSANDGYKFLFYCAVRCCQLNDMVVFRVKLEENIADMTLQRFWLNIQLLEKSDMGRFRIALENANCFHYWTQLVAMVEKNAVDHPLDVGEGLKEPYESELDYMTRVFPKWFSVHQKSLASKPMSLLFHKANASSQESPYESVFQPSSAAKKHRNQRKFGNRNINASATSSVPSTLLSNPKASSSTIVKESAASKPSQTQTGRQFAKKDFVKK